MSRLGLVLAGSLADIERELHLAPHWLTGHNPSAVVVGSTFAWAHVPRAGGEMIRALFGLYPELVQYADPAHTPQQHVAFHRRPDMVAGKELILNIRRLPAWTLGFHQFGAQIGLGEDPKPGPMASPHEMALSQLADRQITRFTSDGRFKIDRWLRAEHLSDDFFDLIAAHGVVRDGDRERAQALGRVNEMVYDKDVSHWFTSAHISLLYERNPRWAAAEREAYGGTLA